MELQSHLPFSISIWKGLASLTANNTSPTSELENPLKHLDARKNHRTLDVAFSFYFVHKSLFYFMRFFICADSCADRFILYPRESPRNPFKAKNNVVEELWLNIFRSFKIHCSIHLCGLFQACLCWQTDGSGGDSEDGGGCGGNRNHNHNHNPNPNHDHNKFMNLNACIGTVKYK